MEIRPIRSDAEHDDVLREIEALWGSAPGTVDGDRLDVLVTLAEVWEKKQVPMPPPSPLEAIRFRLEQLGLDHKALVGIIGSRSRVYEVMGGTRPLTLAMIRKLTAELGISADILIREQAPRGDVA